MKTDYKDWMPKDLGYEEVQLIDTTYGKFMSKWESLWMELSGSTLLVGRK